MAQLVARAVWDREAPGSSPGSPTTKSSTHTYMMKKFSLYISVLTAFILVPHFVLGADSNISNVIVDSISDTTPGASASYQITFSHQFTLNDEGGMTIRVFPVVDGIVGSSGSTGFDFTNTTFSSDDINGEGSAVAGGTEYSISFSENEDPATQTITLNNITNSGVEGDYVIGLSVTLNAEDEDHSTSESFTIFTDPCEGIETVTLNDSSIATFGTNAIITRGSIEDESAIYSLSYATSQADIDTDIATTIDTTLNSEYILSNLLPETLYYFQTRATDTNNCVLAQTTLTGTTETIIANTPYTKPTTSNVKRRSAKVDWVTTPYVDSYTLQLWSTKKRLKTFRNITSTNKMITKKYLRAGRKYRVRVRGYYEETQEKTAWSEFKRFKTK